jgi:hypothetical protein
MGSVKALASQLQRGEKLLWVSNHHNGMAELKRQLGNPRPQGRKGKRPAWTLSLVNPHSPSAYDGHDGYRLSTDPADYVWETYSDNLSRRDSAAMARAVSAAGLRSIELHGNPGTVEGRTMGGRVKGGRNQWSTD